jgi:hypothetical protein
VCRSSSRSDPRRRPREIARFATASPGRPGGRRAARRSSPLRRRWSSRALPSFAICTHAARRSAAVRARRPLRPEAPAARRNGRVHPYDRVVRGGAHERASARSASPRPPIASARAASFCTSKGSFIDARLPSRSFVRNLRVCYTGSRPCDSLKDRPPLLLPSVLFDVALDRAPVELRATGDLFIAPMTIVEKRAVSCEQSVGSERAGGEACSQS